MTEKKDSPIESLRRDTLKQEFYYGIYGKYLDGMIESLGAVKADEETTKELCKRISQDYESPVIYYERITKGNYTNVIGNIAQKRMNLTLNSLSRDYWKKNLAKQILNETKKPRENN
jgi:hypothetical protein